MARSRLAVRIKARVYVSLTANTQDIEFFRMFTKIIAVVLAMAAASVASGLFAKIWPATRLTMLKGALIGPIAAAPTAVLLQLLGGGLIGFTELGTIDWPPVASTMMAGALCGVIVVGAVGLIRMGSRRPYR